MQVGVSLPCVRVACHDVGVSAYKEMTDGEVVYARGPYKAKLRFSVKNLLYGPPATRSWR